LVTQDPSLERNIHYLRLRFFWAKELAYLGDVIGINSSEDFAIGDTIYTGDRKVAFPGISMFSPEKFTYIRNPNPSTYKSFQKGINQLLDEGAVQALRQGNDDDS
jgi:peptide chain release factor 3